VMRQIDSAAGEPARPLRSPGIVEGAVVGSREFDREVLDDGIPEPADVVLRSAVELTPVVDPLLAHEGGHAGPLHGRGIGSPDDLACRQLAYAPPMQYGPAP